MEREKALDMALGQIEKQFGKGAVMRMNEEAKVKIASIPTGALSLDLALGIGGLPRGRVVEVYGPESSGKCLPAGTYVWSDQGLETIEELFARVGQKTSCTSRVTDVTDAGVRLVNEQSELEPMAAVTHNHRKPVWRVELESGRHVEATENHPLRVLNERGCIVWRTIGELQEGDVLVSALFGAETAVGGSDLSEHEAVLLGYLVSEGTLGRSNHNSVTFTNAHDPDVFAEYCELMDEVLDVDPARIRTYTTMNHRLHDTAVRRRLADDYGLDYVGSAAKEIPHAVRTAGAKIQRAFLSALYEGDGWIEQGPEIGYTSASRTLAEQVQLLLLGLGIPASLRARHHDELDRDYHTVLVPPGAAARFLEQVGFRSERRAQQLARHLRESAPNTHLEHIPHMKHLLLDLRDALGGDRALDKLIHDVTRHDLTGRADGSIDCSPTRLRKVLEWIEGKYVPASARPLVAQLHELTARPLTYERVTAVVPMGEQPTFDVVLPQTHSFLANGVLSHNTTVALHAIAEAQKAGGIAAFIDAEHALDPSYAAALGVDIEGLLVSQPDTGEQALEITDMLIRSNAIDIVVIDSVAALTPRAEIEGEMGDAHVGLQARLMSQALRKLAGTLHRSKTCALFVNQIREKVGVMFGSPETQPGGRALKFYSSVRLDVRRIESLKDGTDFVGNRVRVKVVKNKCVAEGTRIFDPTTGLTHRIEDVIDRGEGTAVWAADKAGRLHVRPIGARMNQGEQEVIGLRLVGGTLLRVTRDHRILTEHGWREAGDLAAGDRVARPLQAGTFGQYDTASMNLLSAAHTEPVLDHLAKQGLTARQAARLVGDGSPEAGMRGVLGKQRLHRDRVARLAEALDSAFLREVLTEELYYGRVVAILPPERARTFDIEVAELHNFVADDVVVHNCAPPFKQAEFDILFGEGISREGSVLDVGVDEGIVKKAGAWYTYDGEQLGQGREKARQFLKEHDEVTAEIYKKVTEALGLVPTDVTGDEPGEPIRDEAAEPSGDK